MDQSGPIINFSLYCIQVETFILVPCITEFFPKLTESDIFPGRTLEHRFKKKKKESIFLQSSFQRRISVIAGNNTLLRFSFLNDF